ncbi:MAG: hypothetical protein R3E10_13640 [Gemmatimonadota bacterium]
MNGRWVASGILALGALLGASALQAQQCNQDELGFDCPESWGMKYYTSVSLFTGLGVPERRAAGSFELGFEGGWVPQLSDDERRLGFNGTKLEDTNKTPVFGRIRATVYGPGGLSVSAGVVPPLEVGGAKPLLFDAALGLPLVERDALRVGGRVYGQVGTVQGDITCDAQTVSYGSDPVRNPFLCEEPSEDEVTQRYAGVELSAAFPHGALEPYVAASVNYLDMVFEVRARYSGVTDRRDMQASGVTYAGAAGLRYRLSEALSLTGELFYTPLGIVRPPATVAATEALLNARAMVSWRVR